MLQHNELQKYYAKLKKSDAQDHISYDYIGGDSSSCNGHEVKCAGTGDRVNCMTW